jgi:hypothetical protein
VGKFRLAVRGYNSEAGITGPRHQALSLCAGPLPCCRRRRCFWALGLAVVLPLPWLPLLLLVLLGFGLGLSALAAHGFGVPTMGGAVVGVVVVEPVAEPRAFSTYRAEGVNAARGGSERRARAKAEAVAVARGECRCCGGWMQVQMLWWVWV